MRLLKNRLRHRFLKPSTNVAPAQAGESGALRLNFCPLLLLCCRVYRVTAMLQREDGESL